MALDTIAITVNGQLVIVPGVYVNDIITPSVPSGVPTGPLLFVAAGYGGVPFVATNYTDASSLKQAMRGAPSIDFVDFFFNPTPLGVANGTSLVTYINVSPNTRSTATISSSGTPSSGVIQLTSVDYGTPSNLLQYSMQNGSVAG